MRKILSLLTMLIFVLSGCGSNNTEVANKEAYDISDYTFPLEEPVELTMVTQSSPIAPADPNEKLVFQRLEEATNVHINWVNYTSDEFLEKRNLAIASGDLPDAWFSGGFSDYDIITYANQDVIIPLEDYITPEIMPNLATVLGTNPEFEKLMTAEDGHIYTLPWIEELGSGKEAIQSIGGIPWINQQWLDNLGLEMPTTTEELKQVLIAFRDEDADGDGDPSNEIPMSFMWGTGPESLLTMLGAFGYGDNDNHMMIDNDGNVIYTLSQDYYKDIVIYLNDLWNEGLIDPEIFTQDYNTYLAKASTQNTGLYFTWDTANMAGFESGDYSEPESIVSNYLPMPALSDGTNPANVSRSNAEFGFDRSRFAVSSANKNIELTMRWIDKMYEPLQSVQNNWGTYGNEDEQDIFVLEADGSLSHAPLGEASPVELRQKQETLGPLAVLNTYYGKYVTLPDDAAARLKVIEEVYAPNMKQENIYPSIMMSKDDIDKITTIETSMFEYSMAKIAGWIQDGGVENEWDAYVTSLYDEYNLQEWIDIRQEYYDAYSK